MALAKTITYLSAVVLILAIGLNFNGNAIQILVVCLCLMVIVGLLRMVQWARYIANAILSISVLIAFVALQPISGRPDIHFMENFSGEMPSNFLLWLAIVAFSIVFIWPIYIFSNNKEKFRGESW